MRRTALMLFLLAGATVTGCGSATSAPRATSASRRTASASSRTASTCLPMTVKTIRLADRGAPGGVRLAQVFTPGGVAQPDSLPVLYFLHGVPGGYRDVGKVGVASSINRQFCEGAKPFLLVAPDGNSPLAGDTEWADDAAGRFDIESFVTGALIKAVEGNHRRPASQRAIAGFSMGAFGAADLALRHPGLYRQFVSLGGYFTIDDPSGAFGRVPGPAREADRRAHEPLLLTAAGRGMRVMLVQGTKDREKLDAGQDAAFAPRLRGDGAIVDSLSLDFPHNYAFVSAAIPGMVTFLESGWVTGRSQS